MQHAEFVHSTIHSYVFAYSHVIVHKKKKLLNLLSSMLAKHITVLKY